MPAFLDSNAFHYVFLPLLSLVSGFVCLYIDPKKSDKTAIVVVVVLAISAVATGAAGFMDDQKSKEKQNASDTEAKKQTELLNTTQQNVQYLIVLLQSSKGGALAAAKPNAISHTLVQQSLAASVALNQQGPARASAGSKPEIQYFSKDIDKSVVLQALQDAGFRFTPKAAVLKDDPTNSIWVGDSVSLSDLKVVALTLVRAGVQIHAIQRFREDSPRHDKLVIQIGAYPAMDSAPIWTVDRIGTLSGLPPRETGPGLPLSGLQAPGSRRLG